MPPSSWGGGANFNTSVPQHSSAVKQNVFAHPWQNGFGYCCNKIAEAEAAVSVNEKKWLVMHMHVQLKLDELGRMALAIVYSTVRARIAFALGDAVCAVRAWLLHADTWQQLERRIDDVLWLGSAAQSAAALPQLLLQALARLQQPPVAQQQPPMPPQQQAQPPMPPPQQPAAGQ